MPRFFLYRSKHTSEECRADTKELLINYGISSAIDIIDSNFNENYSGLNYQKESVAFVVPGGSAYLMEAESDFPKKIQIVEEQTKLGCHFIGICAGGFLGVDWSDTFGVSYHLLHPQQIAIPNYFTRLSCTFKLMSNYIAYGAFCPDKAYFDYRFGDESNKYVPYATNITFNQSHAVLPMLYIGGCGFRQKKSPAYPDDEPVANYSENSYKFQYPNCYDSFPLSAMIRKQNKLKTTTAGNILLTGVHIEASVKNSKLLTFFTPYEKKNEDCLQLSKAKYDDLINHQEKVREQIIPLIQETLNLKK